MTEILLYGEVGWDFDAGWLDAALAEADGDVTLRVHSPGGDVFEGVAISNAIRHAIGQGTRVRAVVDGLCASAASYMCLTASEVLAGPGAVFMIHPPSGGCYGTASDMREMAQALDTCNDTIRDLYERRTGRPRGQIDEAMAAQTWMTAERAVEWGLADGLDESDAPGLAAASERWAGLPASDEFAAFARRHPALESRLESYRDHAGFFAKRLLEAGAGGIPVAHDAHCTMAATDENGDGAGEAPDAGAGEAPAFAVANGHIYRIGKRKE